MTPVSSCSSRTAVCSGVSPASMNPAGRHQSPARGSQRRFTNNTRPASTSNTPAAGTGLRYQT